jgi:DNA-binding transcriptional MerR regulator
MQIGELAKKAGVNTQTIRFYERNGLLNVPPRTASGYRAYSENTAQIVRFIKQSKELGYTLAEIKQLLALHEHSGNATQVRALAIAKIASINDKLEIMTRMRDDLKNMIANCKCGDEGNPDCPAVIKLDYRATEV